MKNKTQKKLVKDTAWMIILQNKSMPSGVFNYASLAVTKSESIRQFMRGECNYTWPQFRRWGYRCVKVRLEEIC